LEITYSLKNERQLKIILYHNTGLKLILELQQKMEIGMEELLIVGDTVLLFRRTAIKCTRSSRGELNVSLVLFDSSTISLIIFSLSDFL